MALSETDRIDILLDADGDIVFDQGDFAFSSGVEGVVQDVKIDIQYIKGEWELDRNKGVPLLENDFVTEKEALLGQKFEDRKWRSAYREVLARNALVDSVIALGVDYDEGSRGAAVSFEVDTIFGESGSGEVETP